MFRSELILMRRFLAGLSLALVARSSCTSTLGRGGFDIWVARRGSTTAEFVPEPENLSTLNTPRDDLVSSISSDGMRLYLVVDASMAGSAGTPTADLYFSTRSCRR